MGIRDRLRRLEERFRDGGPTLEEVRDAWEGITEGARAKLRGQPVPYEDRRRQDRDTIERWAEAEGVDLEGEAERARQKLLSMRGSYAANN
jgi:hypothetical protein